MVSGSSKYRSVTIRGSENPRSVAPSAALSVRHGAFSAASCVIICGIATPSHGRWFDPLPERPLFASKGIANLFVNDCTLVIMAKAPREGSVKTRLSQSLPPAAVTDLYRCLLFDTIALARSIREVNVAIMCPMSDVEDLARIVGDFAPIIPQKGNGLAAGLTSVFATFVSGRHRRVIAFDSDSPHLPPSVIKGAFVALATCDLVVGPTEDGGYYLVGATAYHPTLFMGDSLGTANALETLVAQSRSLGLSLHLTDTFYDIDLPTDLSRVAAELQLDPAKAPRTAKWLSGWSRTVSAGQDHRTTEP